MDYLDEMIKAGQDEEALWKMAAWDGEVHEIRRGPEVIERFTQTELSHIRYDRFYRLRNRAAMKAAYEAAQQVHWGNPLATLDKPRDLKWTDCPASEPATVRYVVDDPFEKDAAFNREEAVAWFNAIFQTNEKIADAVVKDAGLYGVGMTKIACAGAGIALMSISHPPCAMFPEEEETQAERIARVTREMCGG